MAEYVYRVVQDGMVVAKVYSTNKSTAVREINHYATMYMCDGNVEIQERRNKKYVTVKRCRNLSVWNDD